MKRLVGLLVFGALWIPSTWLGIHDIGKQDTCRSSPCMCRLGRSALARASMTPLMRSVARSPTPCTRFMPAVARRCSPRAGSTAARPRGGRPRSRSRETRTGEPQGWSWLGSEAVGDALGEQQFAKVYTPPGCLLNGPTLPSLTDQVAATAAANSGHLPPGHRDNPLGNVLRLPRGLDRRPAGHRLASEPDLRRRRGRLRRHHHPRPIHRQLGG